MPLILVSVLAALLVLGGVVLVVRKAVRRRKRRSRRAAHFRRVDREWWVHQKLFGRRNRRLTYRSGDQGEEG